MMKIQLLTAAGELVHEAAILPFLIAPEVILWGTRVFVFRGSVERDETVWRYHEGLLYPLIDGVTGQVTKT